MKSLLRKWLGIKADVEVIQNNFNAFDESLRSSNDRIYEMFHTLPFTAGIISLTAKDAARLTLPNEVTPNSLSALLTGIVIEARQGNSSLQVTGTFSTETREALVGRGFKVEDIQGSNDNTGTFILWM